MILVPRNCGKTSHKHHRLNSYLKVKTTVIINWPKFIYIKTPTWKLKKIREPIPIPIGSGGTKPILKQNPNGNIIGSVPV